MSGVQTITVGADEGDQRLDRWLKRRFPHLVQTRIEKMCRKGELRVEGGRVKPATRLEVGQSVRVPPIPEAHEVESRPVDRSQISKKDAEMIRGCVIYRDDHIIAINKPAGLPTQGGSGVSKHVDGLAEALRDGFEDKPRLVHRLDKDTSGVLLLARTRTAAKGLTENLKHRETRKIYWAAVAGAPQPRAGIIKYGLVKAMGHGKGGEGEKMQCIHPAEVDKTPGAKRATTEFATISALGQRVSWMALVPVTGRTHQLRAHMAEIGHPVVGDGKYGGSSQENLGDGWGSGLGAEIDRKLHLHARSLKIEHPVTKAVLQLVAPLPEHMERTWDFLGWDAREAPMDPFDPNDPLA
ncbi:MAG: RluA family pseudouridine synthase [Limimaricola soesokkakensis]|uniref:RluA family pseudouridine synthase n=1 Tax=Limimaricola soesokkakensis TaxID=1343159 RepID=UPI004058AB24